MKESGWVAKRSRSEMREVMRGVMSLGRKKSVEGWKGSRRQRTWMG